MVAWDHNGEFISLKTRPAAASRRHRPAGFPSHILEASLWGAKEHLCGDPTAAAPVVLGMSAAGNPRDFGGLRRQAHRLLDVARLASIDRIRALSYDRI